MDARWDDLKAVLYVVRFGTLAGAADALDVAYTTVSRRISRAERDLDEQLFHRSADGYHPTEAGVEVATHATRMEDHQTAMLRHLSGQDQTLRGSLVITAPQLLIANSLCDMLDGFMTEYPEIDLTIRATNDRLDLDRREADLAIRISHTPGDSLTGLRLTNQTQASFATPDLARRLADNPDATIDWIMHISATGPPKASLTAFPNSRIKLQFDDMVAIIGAAKAGLGLVRLPFFLGQSTDGLIQVHHLPPQPYLPIWVVAHRDVWKSAKVTAFRKHLVNFVKARPELFH